MSLLFLFNLKFVWLEESYRKYRDLKESAAREKKGKHFQVCCYIFCTTECTCLSMYNCVYAISEYYYSKKTTPSHLCFQYTCFTPSIPTTC